VLTDEGRAQAEAARGALADVRFDLVVATGLERTAETARIVAGAEPERWPELNEWEGGRLHDVPEEELEDMFVGALQVVDDDDRFLGG
jgi:probable phosphoglycerate mutase